MWKPVRILATTAIWKALPRATGSWETNAAGETTSRPEGTCDGAEGKAATMIRSSAPAAIAAASFTAAGSFTLSPACRAAGNHAAHDFKKVFARSFRDESVFGIRPAQLDAGGKRGDPDFAHRRIGGHHRL